jgi:hypothetical protein
LYSSNGFTKLKTRKTEILVSNHNKGPLQHKYRHSPESQEVESASTSPLASGQPSEDLSSCLSEFPSYTNSNLNTQALDPAEAFPPFVGLQFYPLSEIPSRTSTHVWYHALGQQLRIVPLHIQYPNSSFLNQLWQPITRTSREAREEASHYLGVFQQVNQHTRDENFQGAIHQDMDTKIGLDLSNDIFVLQMMDQESKPPDVCQKEAYDKVRNW